jgi:uncharacterized protein YodC (DUF2158 family)
MMMSKIDDGGPAFPSDEYQTGMTLRDWFAGQALRARWGDGSAMTPEEAAQMAYQLADAMIEEGRRA